MAHLRWDESVQQKAWSKLALEAFYLNAIRLVIGCHQRDEMTLLRMLRLLYILEWIRLWAIQRHISSVSFTAFINVCLHFFGQRRSGVWNWNGVGIHRNTWFAGRFSMISAKQKLIMCTFGPKHLVALLIFFFSLCIKCICHFSFLLQVTRNDVMCTSISTLYAPEVISFFDFHWK